MEIEFDWESGHAPGDMVDELRAFEDALDDELESAAERLAESIHDDIEALAPVDTGQLRDSYKDEVKQVMEKVIEARVKTGVEYAPFQEFLDIGTPHVGPALEKNKETLEDEAEAAWNAAVQEVS